MPRSTYQTTDPLLQPVRQTRHSQDPCWCVATERCKQTCRHTPVKPSIEKGSLCSYSQSRWHLPGHQRSSTCGQGLRPWMHCGRAQPGRHRSIPWRWGLLHRTAAPWSQPWDSGCRSSRAARCSNPARHKQIWCPGIKAFIIPTVSCSDAWY